MIKPLYKNLLVEELPPRPKSEGGIMLPPAAYQDPVYIVRAKGPKADIAIYEGDRVILDQFQMSSKHQAGDRLWIIPDSAVSVIVSAKAL